MMKKALFACALSLGLVSAASASTISYTVDIGGGTFHHNSVAVAILEVSADGSQMSFDFGNGTFLLNPTGQTTISHDVAFNPAFTLIVGNDLRNGPLDTRRPDILMFMDAAFAYSHLDIRFDGVFPHTGHDDFMARVTAATVDDDADQQAWLLAFLKGDGAPAAFASAGPSLGVEFTHLAVPPPVVPEPASLVLLGTGLVGAIALRRRKSAR